MNVTSFGKRVFGDAIHLRILRWKDALGYPGWPQMQSPSSLEKTEEGNFTDTLRRHVKMQVPTEVMHPEPRVRECCYQQMLGEGKEWIWREYSFIVTLVPVIPSLNASLPEL